MVTGFTRPITVTFHVPTATADLVLESSGANAAGQVGIDKLQGDGTGYTNYWQDYDATAHFKPGVLQRYDKDAGGYRFLGECGLKLDTRYLGLVNSGSYVTIKGVDWDYRQVDELGVGFANDRIVLGLTRKRTTP
jgi:hypothetical protein